MGVMIPIIAMTHIKHEGTLGSQIWNDDLSKKKTAAICP